MLRLSHSLTRNPACGLLLFASLALLSHGQTVHQLTGPTYTQNFDGSGSLVLPTGWGFGQGVPFANTTTSATQSGGTVGAGILSGSSAGGSYYFTNGTLGTDTDRSIGYLTSGTFSNNRDILFGFRNTTGQYITTLGLTFDYEKYRAGFQSRDWAFFGSASDSAWGSALAGGAQNYAADANATDVFAPPQSVTKSVTISGLNIAPEANYYFRWNYSGSGTGSGAQALGLDNLGISATLIGGILYWDPNGALAGLGGSGLWDASALNWNIESLGTAAPRAAAADREIIFSGGGGTVTLGSGAAANAGITFNSNGYALSSGSLALGSVAITVTSGLHTVTIASAITGGSGLRKAGAGKLTLTGANSFSGGTTISGGVLEISSEQTLGGSASGVALGGGTLKTTASIALSAGRSLSGSGTIDIAPSTALMVSGTTTAGALVLTNTGTLRLSGVAPAVDSLDLQQSGIIDSGSDAIRLGGPLTSSHASGTATISAGLDLGNLLRTFTIGNGSSDIDVLLSGILTSGTGGRLLKVGAGTLSLTGANSGLAGGVQLGTATATGGVLVIQGNNTLGSSGTLLFHSGTLRASAAVVEPAGIALDFGGSSTLSAAFEGSAMQFLGSAQFSGTSAHSIVANTDLSISGAVSGSSPGIAIQGTGSITLENGGSFTGDITVNSGALILNGPLTAATRPAISVTASGMLAGDQTTGSLGTILVNGGTLSPGNFADSTGTLITTALDIRTGSTLAIQLGGLSLGNYDHLNVNGTVSLGGTLALSLIGGFVPIDAMTFTLVNNDATDAVSGTFSGIPNGATILAAGSAFTINYAGGDGNDVVLTTIPEPGSASLLLTGIALLAPRRRTRGTV